MTQSYGVLLFGTPCIIVCCHYSLFPQNAVHEQSIKDNDHRITTEVANMMAKLEATKNDLLKYFAGKIYCRHLHAGQNEDIW